MPEERVSRGGACLRYPPGLGSVAPRQREAFDAKKLEELAGDIHRRGKVLQPVLGRRNPSKLGEIELIFGARRFRASKLANRTTIPMMIREHTDEEVLEIQIVENVNREDVHPLEEADGFQQLHDKHAISVEEIAAKTGKAPGTIRLRLKLTSLVPEARKAYLEGKLTNATALVVARIPDPEVQRKATKAIVAGFDQRDPGPMSLSSASWMVTRDFMLRLADAPFSCSDADLVPAAGSCLACPKSTANQRELFADVEAKDNLCTDQRCHAAKVAADWKLRKAKAETRGHTVLDKKASKSLFSHGQLVTSSGFVDIAAKDYSAAGSPTFKAQLKGKDVPIVLAQDDAGRTRELVKRSDFSRVVPKKPSSSSSSSSGGYDHKKEKEKRERERALHVLEALELANRAVKKPVNDAFWRALARITTESTLDADGYKVVGEWVGIGDLAEIKGSDYRKCTKAVRAAIAKLSPERTRGLVVLLLGLSHAVEDRAELVAVYGKPEVKLLPATATDKARPCARCTRAKKSGGTCAVHASAKAAVDMTKKKPKAAAKAPAKKRS